MVLSAYCLFNSYQRAFYFLLVPNPHPFPNMRHFFAEQMRFLFRVVEVHTCTRRASNAERLHERLRAVVARADAHMLCVEYACNVMRMNIVDGERDDAAVTVCIGIADDMYVRNIFHVVHDDCRKMVVVFFDC